MWVRIERRLDLKGGGFRSEVVRSDGQDIRQREREIGTE
jgi:hypothetical protein